MQKTSQKPQVYLIRRYPLNDATPIEWDQTLSWMQELLEELCQEVESTDLELMKTQGLVPKINFSGTLSRNHNHELKDFFVVKGELSAEYATYSGKNGDGVIAPLTCPIKAIYIDHEILKESEQSEEITYYFDGEEYDLYSMENDLVDLQELFHEYLYLNLNPYS